MEDVLRFHCYPYDRSFCICVSGDELGRQTEAVKLSAVSHCNGNIASRCGWSSRKIAAPAVASWLTRRRVCSADLFNKSIGRQSYSFAVLPSHPTSLALSDIALVAVREGGLRRPGAPSVDRATGHYAAFPVSGSIGTFL